MSRAKLLLLSVVAALSVVALMASSASAKISFEWFVGGTLLKAGEQQTFHLNNDGHIFDLHSAIAGTNVLLLSTKISVEKGLLFGGRPGTNEEVVVFEGVTADFPLTACTPETGGIANPTPGIVKTVTLKTEIVEGENGEVLILFTPKEGAAFVKIKFLGASCPLGSGTEAPVEGSVLGLPLPQRVEVLRQNLVFPAVTDLYLLVNGETKPLLAALTFGAEPATLTGLTLILLTSDKVFGPF